MGVEIVSETLLVAVSLRIPSDGPAHLTGIGETGHLSRSSRLAFGDSAYNPIHTDRLAPNAPRDNYYTQR